MKTAPYKIPEPLLEQLRTDLAKMIHSKVWVTLTIGKNLDKDLATEAAEEMTPEMTKNLFDEIEDLFNIFMLEHGEEISDEDYTEHSLVAYVLAMRAAAVNQFVDGSDIEIHHVHGSETLQ